MSEPTTTQSTTTQSTTAQSTTNRSTTPTCTPISTGARRCRTPRVGPMAVTTKIADLTGPGHTDAYGVGGTDLGIVTTAPDGRLLAVFGDTFDRAIAEFAVTYADQNERDHSALVDAITSGRVTAQLGI